jgi:predicted transcriptional regulator
MAMTLRLTDEETEALRHQSQLEHRSMQAVARAAIREYIEQRSHMAKVDEALDVLTPRYADLLRRLEQLEARCKGD